MAKHVLVTGGAGFIGSHLVDAYLQRGWRVSVLDDLSTGSRENLDPRAELIEGDLRDASVVARAMSGKPDLISHHAAQMDLRRSVAEPAYDAEINVVGSLNLLQAATDAGVLKFIFASTGGAIYGEPESAPQDERHPTRPLSPYGCAKLSVEHYLDYFSKVKGLGFAALRYANVYGPRQRTDGEAGVVAIFGRKLLRGDPVTINGSGAQTRDFVFIDDVVRANLAVSESALDGTFNVGTGVETSVLDLFQAIQKAVGASATPFHGPAKEGEQLRSVLDGRMLRRAAELPEPVPLHEGLGRTVAWLRATGH